MSDMGITVKKTEDFLDSLPYGVGMFSKDHTAFDWGIVS